ncbi:MAG: O-antigen ligase family protein [Candidatus Moranbacteria bacterium]|nr:O-antigen ligase family protein [Candidatus Moranbacteria bacterium]
MQKLFLPRITKITKLAFLLFLASVPFCLAYPLNFLEKNKSFTSFSLYNVYLIDFTAAFLILVFLANLFSHKKSILAFCKNKLCFFFAPALAFALLAVFSFSWSGSPLLSFIDGMRIFLIISAVLITIFISSKSRHYRSIFRKTLIAAGSVESLIAFGQFIFGRSLGLYLLGESHLGSEILGLARINLLGHDFLRAYGTFPHPNMLGGFLLFTLVITYVHRSIGNRNILLGLQILGLFLTFSRSAILGLTIIILFLYLSSRVKPWDLSQIKKEIPPLHFNSVGMTILIILLFSLFIIRAPIQNIFSGRSESVQIRLEYAGAAYHRFLDSPLLGRGWGSGPVELLAFSSFPFYPWEMQPVHNIYLLVLSDLGIIGLFSFLYFIYRVLAGPKNIWKFLLIAYLFIGFFDHYFLTLPQGIFIFFGSALLACPPKEKLELAKAAALKAKQKKQKTPRPE